MYLSRATDTDFESDQELVEACRRQLVDDGLMVFGDDGYQLTDKGIKAVRKELQRYQMKPARVVLLETFFLTANQVSVF